VAIHARREGDEVIYSVADTGIGIPADQLERLFKPFVQIDSRLSRQHGGTGLGLALAYGMAQLHGGTIEVGSAVGKGSHFDLILPWNPQAQKGVKVREETVTEEAGAPPPPQAPPPGGGGGGKIVVDGRLRAAPFVTGGMAKDLVVGGAFTPAEASALAKKLGPPVASLPERAAGGPGRPVAGAPPAAAPDASTLRDLQGSWTVLSATRNSLVVPDAKLAGATWTFDGGTLTATDGTGTTTRFSLGTDAAAPGALRLDPVAPSREHGGWMLARREGERLVLAFFDGLAGRPESFAPEPKKVLLVLSRPGGAASPSPCDILAKAGVASLLPEAVREPERERRGGGPACALADAAGREVVLLLIPGAERAVFEAEAEKLRKNAPQDVRDEPQLGPTAVSSRKGYRALYLFLEKGTLVFLVFQIPGPEPDRFREFARRVRAEVRG
jgi:uncharacterized protein (TIGR03067 family)